jgi:hypothetical protein
MSAGAKSASLGEWIADPAPAEKKEESAKQCDPAELVELQMPPIQ